MESNKSFMCVYCSDLFRTKAHCARHEKTCQAISSAFGSFKCSNCQVHFNRQDALNAHMKRCLAQAQGQLNPAEGASCDLEKLFKCKYCTFTFADETSCSSHEKFCRFNESFPFMCHICGRSYAKKQSLYGHLKKCSSVTHEQVVQSKQADEVVPGHSHCGHSCSKPSSESAGTLATSSNPPDQEDLQVGKESENQDQVTCNKTSFECEYCAFLCNKKTTLHRHEKNCSSKVKKASLYCQVKGCQLVFTHRKILIKHLRMAHHDEVVFKDTVLKEFSSFEEFLSWKETEELNTYSYFTKRCGRNLTDKGKKCYYVCQHDGKRKHVPTTKRANSRGTIRVGNQCIAQMNVYKSFDKIMVEYFPTHSHPCSPQDLKHQPLPKDITQFIEDQLDKDVSTALIYARIQEMCQKGNPEDARIIKIKGMSRKVITERARKRRTAKRLDSDDLKSVDLLIEQKKEDDSVLLYKPVGGRVVVGPEDIDHVPNADDLFMLGIQTQRQAQLMRELGTEVLVVDQAHGTNKLEYKLLTCLVVDSDRRGWPVAHLITSRTEPDTLKYFFAALKNRLGEEKINCVITDHDMGIIDGMRAGLGTNVRYLLCQWKVINDLKERLRQTLGKKHYRQIVKELTAIINEESKIRFGALVDNFVTNYAPLETTKSFIDYFNEHYQNQPEIWATCHRSFAHSEINTTCHVRSFHNALKKSYFRYVLTRLDDLVNNLYKTEEDNHSARLREQNVGFLTLPQPILERHEQGLTIADKAVEQVLHNVYEVAPRSSDGKTRVVIKYDDTCESNPCHWQCNNEQCLDLCSHMYSCDCPDRHPLCEHIHKLHSYITRLTPCIVEQDVPEVMNSEEEINSGTVSQDLQSLTYATELVNDQVEIDFNADLLTDAIETVTVEYEDPNTPPETTIQFQIEPDAAPTAARKRRRTTSGCDGTPEDSSKRQCLPETPEAYETETGNGQYESHSDPATSTDVSTTHLLDKLDTHLKFLNSFVSSSRLQDVSHNLVEEIDTILSQAVSLIQGTE